MDTGYFQHPRANAATPSERFSIVDESIRFFEAERLVCGVAGRVVNPRVGSDFSTALLASPGLACRYERCAHAASPILLVHAPCLQVGYGARTAADGVRVQRQLGESDEGFAVECTEGGLSGIIGDRDDFHAELVDRRFRPQGVTLCDPCDGVRRGQCTNRDVRQGRVFQCTFSSCCVSFQNHRNCASAEIPTYDWNTLS